MPGLHEHRALRRREPLVTHLSEPERLFRIDGIDEVDEVDEIDGIDHLDPVVSVGMPTGPWLAHPGGQVAAGSLGVLVDNAVGYAVLLDRPPGHWSVSAEISIDVCAPLRMGVGLHAQGRPIHSDPMMAVASGHVVDDDGRLVAVCRQHGRFVPTMPAPAADAGDPAEAESPATASSTVARGGLLELLGGRLELRDGAATLELTTSRELVNPLGNLHGGITLCAGEIAGFAAVATGSPHLETSSISVAYLRPVPLGTDIRFQASVIHAGRSFGVAQVHAVRADGKLAATATVTAGSRAQTS
jgi:uncharacterized protein (TIGR00369 family)